MSMLEEHPHLIKLKQVLYAPQRLYLVTGVPPSISAAMPVLHISRQTCAVLCCAPVLCSCTDCTTGSCTSPATFARASFV